MAFLPGTGSYHDARGFGVAESLRRARAPHRLGNTFIGLGLAGFIASVYMYSISAVKQDDFSDVTLQNAPQASKPQ